MHYPDLAPCDYFGASHAGVLRAVGWLEPGHELARGPVDERFFAALMALLVDPWQPPAVAAGFARCGLCRFSGGPGAVHVDGRTVKVGHNNLFVPAGEVVYVAPSTIVHYIDAHEYAPPDAFQAAVLACPEMRSFDYLKAISRFGIHRAPA